MWNRRLCFLLLLGEGVYLGMLYNYQGIRLMLCFLIFLPLVCLLLLLLSLPACRVVLRTGQDVSTRGEQVEVRVAVENRGLFPVSRVLVCVRWKAPGQKEVRMKRWICGLGRGCRGEAVFALSPQHCGQARFRVSRVRVYDYLALFCLPGKVFLEGRFFERRCSGNQELCIAPRVDPVSREEKELFSPVHRGEEDGDLVLRDYRPGDSLRRIHWKLSEKLDRLQMRDQEPEGLPALYLDFSPGLRRQPDQWDRYLDRACSLLYFLAGEAEALQVPAVVIWKEETSQREGGAFQGNGGGFSKGAGAFRGNGGGFSKGGKVSRGDAEGFSKDGDVFRKAEISSVESLLDWMRLWLFTGAEFDECVDLQSFLRLGEDGVLYPEE